MKTKEILIDIIPLSSPFILAGNLPREIQRRLSRISMGLSFAELGALTIAGDAVATAIKRDEPVNALVSTGIYLLAKVGIGESVRKARRNISP